jgi:glutathione synthase/RimK-type ligase-like ATP-grasp enzyme
MNRCTNIAVSCVGGALIYDLLRAMRATADLDPYIVGLDASPEAPGRMLVDAFRAVPSAESEPETWRSSIADICAQYDLNALILLSEPETSAIAPCHRDLSERGVAISCDPHTAAITNDKLTFLRSLRDAGVSVCDFAEVSGDIRSACEQLGYPRRRVVIKSRNGRGSRNIFVVDQAERAWRPFLDGRLCGTGSLDAVREIVSSRGISNLYAVPFLEGDTFDVDCIARDGAVIDIACRKRQFRNHFTPMSVGHVICMDRAIISYVSSIVAALGFSRALDFDIIMTRDGPVVIDAGARLSGSTGMSFYAGKNMPGQLLRLLHDLPVMPQPIEDGCVFRPFLTQARIAADKQHELL